MQALEILQELRQSSVPPPEVNFQSTAGTESSNKPNPQLRVIPFQTLDEKLAQFAERAQLGVWLVDLASTPEAAALAQKVYEIALDGARSLGHRLAVRPTVEGWRLIPVLLPTWESDDEGERRSR